LIALYCSAVFAGSIPAILIRTPGTPAAICTIYDGYPMAKRGEAGRALGLACWSSVIGGLFSAVMLIFLAEFIADFAIQFGHFEYFMLGVLGLSMVIGMSSDNMIKGLISMAIGLLIPLVGMDSMNGFPRFTFGRVELLSGLQQLPVMIGLFAFSEVFISFSSKESNNVGIQKIDKLFSGFKDIAHNKWLLLKASVIGTYLGALPGVGATTAAIIGYDQAKKGSKHPELMGTGQPEGIIGPECANNAVTGGALIPMLALGIPGDPVTAILLGALMIHGLQPGPLLFSESPVVVKSIYISVIFSYIVIFILSLFSIKLIAKLLKVKSSILSVFVLLFCVIGSYALQNSYFDVIVALVFGLIGYWMRKDGYSLGPMTLALVLGTMIEQKLSGALKLSQGSLLPFVTRPISLVLLLLTVAFVTYSIIKMQMAKKKAKQKAMQQSSQTFDGSDDNLEDLTTSSNSTNINSDIDSAETSKKD
ncbi:MAG: tripartite tricarboxylate transporter permease, partial [Clostridia bacterium]